jgi:ribosomal protein S18 acetylase RimI-like enzyme
MSQPAVEIRAPTDADLDYLAEHLGEADRAEVLAAGHTEIRSALEACWRGSHETFVGLIDGTPVAIGGCGQFGTLMAPVGVPWLLGTDEMRRQRRVLQRYVKAYIARMLEAYPRLINVVHADNLTAIAWLKRLGFAVSSAPVAHPITGAPFHYFEMTRHV